MVLHRRASDASLRRGRSVPAAAGFEVQPALEKRKVYN
jgi:hypothetical protein